MIYINFDYLRLVFVHDYLKKKSIYKREMCIMINFITKFDYLYKHFYLLIIMYIDYKFY